MLLLSLSILIGFLICEVVARLNTRSDQDGQAWLHKRALLPYRFPAEMVRKKMNHYFQKKSEAYIIDDPLLGWTIALNGSNKSGMYQANSQGIRSCPQEYSIKPDSGTLRIALFGDSFTHGDEVTFNKTWGKYLQDDLRKARIKAEVINFGVPGYGIGQAYLRWKYFGRKFYPRFAVFGYQPENTKRVVNIFRSLYSRNTWLVFSKPRFFLNRNGELGLVNSPVIPPEKVADVMKNLHSSPLARYEYWYNPKNYSNSPIFNSRLISLAYTLLTKKQHRPGGRHDNRGDLSYWDIEGEPMRVSIAILRKFVREVREEGSIPIILHIPKSNHIECLAKHGVSPPQYQVLNELKEEGVWVVDPAPEMIGKHRLFKHSHYSSKGGQIVARVLADAILEILEEEKELNSYPGPPFSTYKERHGESLLKEYTDRQEITIDIGNTNDENFIDGGFHSREIHLNHTSVRWTGQTAVLLLPIYPKIGKQPVLTLGIVNTGPTRDNATGGITVTLDEKQLGYTPLNQGENIYQLTLSSPIKKPGVATITITFSPWQPSQLLGTKDTRLLGVMLDWVKLEYK